MVNYVYQTLVHEEEKEIDVTNIKTLLFEILENGKSFTSRFL